MLLAIFMLHCFDTQAIESFNHPKLVRSCFSKHQHQFPDSDGSYFQFASDFADQLTPQDPLVINQPASFGKILYLPISAKVVTAVRKYKDYSATYKVDPGDELKIKNKFGNIVVNTWSKNEFKIEVHMQFLSEKESDVDEMINTTKIENYKNGNIVSFRTNTNNGKKIGNDPHQENTIDYIIYMPKDNPITIENEFGDVTLPDLSGKVSLKLEFGNLFAKCIDNKDNDLSISFTKQQVSTINLYAGAIMMDYGKIKIGKVNNMNVKLNSSTITIDMLDRPYEESLLQIEKASSVNKRRPRRIFITSSESDLNLGINQSKGINFDIKTSTGGFVFDKKYVKVTYKSPPVTPSGWSPDETYKGYVGSNNSDDKITVESTNSGIFFK